LPESPEENQKRLLAELQGKNIANYSVLLTAWIQTRMERDKTLVTLSAAGIGLLVTILSTSGMKSVLQLALCGTALASFLITIWSCVQIYQRNSSHLEQEIRGTYPKKDFKLETFDQLSLYAFFIAVLCAVGVGIVSAVNQFIR
jgi:uncharacterized membrane protein